MRRFGASLGLCFGLSLVAALVVGCPSSETMMPPDEPTVFNHVFPPVAVAPGEEIADLCQSWTLGNETPLYVNAVEMHTGPGWHHSNWLFVPDDAFEGPDGIWPCSDRQFDQVSGGIRGGVLYAQSTQATDETQQFQPGVAVVIPRHGRVIGTTHALNTSDDALSTGFNLSLHVLPEAEVVTRLHAISLQYRSLEIAPSAVSRFSSTCPFGALHQSSLARPIDMKIYHVLPHYHSLGVGLTIEAVGGTKDGQVIFQSNSPIGEPTSTQLSPPFDLSGIESLRFSCTFDNPRTEQVGWGIGDQEMCAFLAFTDSELTWAGGVQTVGQNQVLGPDAEGVILNEAECELFNFVPRD